MQVCGPTSYSSLTLASCEVSTELPPRLLGWWVWQGQVGYAFVTTSSARGVWWCLALEDRAAQARVGALCGGWSEGSALAVLQPGTPS